MTEAEEVQGAEPAKPTVAGIYDAFLGGNENTPTERESADRLRTVMPEIEATAQANRSFHQRAGRWLAEQGVRQFIDLGSGLPTQYNTHQVVQGVSPDARVVYVDFDPRTAQLGAELVAGSANTAFVQADLCEPDEVLGHPELRRLIDLDQPVALLATAVMHFISDERDPWGIVKGYLDASAPGSYLALTHVTADKQPARVVQTAYSIYKNSDAMMYFRNRDQVEWFFTGLDLVPPYENADAKVTFMGIWGCEDPVAADDDTGRWCYAGVGRVRAR